MLHRTGPLTPKDGFFNTFIEPMIGEDNNVRVIAAFVDSLDLEKIGLPHAVPKKTGAPPYHPALLLKLYMYGHFNRIRSSRMLERECGRNIELWWLLQRAVPSYHTIATFRSAKTNRKLFKEVFRLFNQILKGADLFGNELVAIDGTKILAQNSKKNNVSEEKTLKKLEHNSDKFLEYMDELDRADAAEEAGEEPLVAHATINKALDEIITRSTKLEGLLVTLQLAQAADPSVTQISLTDPEARAMATNNAGNVQIAYNVQSTGDDKNCLVADFSVENTSDIYLLGKMSINAKQVLGVDTLRALADKGYHYGAELQKCADQNITTLVAFPEPDYKSKQAGFQKQDFKFDETKGVYTCPENQELTTTGKVTDKKNRLGLVQNQVMTFKLPYKTCAACPFSDKCLTAASHENRHGRSVERSIYEAAVEANRLRVINNRDTYKRRQAIIEHPFGTIKRSWGFYYTLLKGKEKVGAEYSFVFLAYNLRRAINILGAKNLIERVKTATFAKPGYGTPICVTLLEKPKMMGRICGAGRMDHALLGMAA